MNEIVTAFDKFAIGEVNETYERFLFNNRSQRENETFESFLSSIRELSKTCGYCEKCVDSLLRDRIVLGIKEVTTQELLLRERTLQPLTYVKQLRTRLPSLKFSKETILRHQKP